MKFFKKVMTPILLVGVWVNISEFVRNEFIVKSYWIEHYQGLGMAFPSEPVNGIAWMIWGFLFATTIFIISKKFNLIETTFLSWFVAFVLMWVVVWNLNVLPNGILFVAAPLSLLEAFVGAYICKKYYKN